MPRLRSFLLPILLPALALLAWSAPAVAATEAEWQAFREDVRAKCAAAAEPFFETAEILVDPFGSESYGLALVRGKARGADVTIMSICVYDKQTQTAEMGGELPSAWVADIAADDVPAWQGATAQCGAACSEIMADLAAEDADSIRDLSDRVRLTADALRLSDAAWDEPARSVLEQVLSLRAGGDFSAVEAGEHACTVYWYGFLDNAGQEVGRHQCLVERTDAGLTVRKLTGEMLAADLLETGEGYRIAVGRSFLAEHAERSYDPLNPDNAQNDNFGNFVGMALASDSTLIILAADMRGFQTPDPTYFSVLVID